MDQTRNIFETKDFCIEEDLDDEINQEIIKKKKILIIVNTVDQAISLYEKYKSKMDNVICYHSRFMQKDRIQKESDIIEKEKTGEPILLISTQVIEVSLDIDFDILFTENAPIDSIIQRAGRINRKREKSDSKVIVFRHSDVSQKYVYPMPEILDKSFLIISQNMGRRLSEKQLIQFVDEVYENVEIENNSDYLEGLNKYQEIQVKYHYIKDNMGIDKVFTREGLDNIEVIPEQFESELISAPIEEKIKYEISIRHSKEYKYPIRRYKDGFNYIGNVRYNYEKGLEFINPNDINNQFY